LRGLVLGSAWCFLISNTFICDKNWDFSSSCVFISLHTVVSISD
jgi:hypothetical protein